MSSKWSGYFKVVVPQSETERMVDNQDVSGSGSYGNYSWYAGYLQGSTTRLQKYKEYESMDQDVEVALALDTIAEHMTENNNKTDLPIDIDMQLSDSHSVKPSLVLTLRTALRHWVHIHEWDNKLFSVSRQLATYGDVFFYKTDDFQSWQYVHQSKVQSALVDKKNVTKIIGWQITCGAEQASQNNSTPYQSPTGSLSNSQSTIVPAESVVRFTLNDDMSDVAPFGESILRPVIKSHKQKMMLEDAILIYRIQRAPERRVYYVDVGKMPPHRVKAHLEQMKNEIRQKKVPSSSGGKESIDSVYNVQSMCLSLDTMIPLLDGRTTKLMDLIKEHNEGKQNWVYSINPETGEIVPGLISWAGITRKNTETIKLTFDNGDSLICTPDHKIPVQGKGFIEAKDITQEDLLWSFGKKQENTTVVKIEKYQLMDTGTLTIDQDHKYHNYHTFATTSCFVRNSEDIFLPTRPDGRGSKVETLPGGAGLGELSDLNYFQEKVWRGLRVPMNWMKSGGDALFQDDKVGTAYIEEIRFSKFVQRLQGYIETVLDKEFKTYLKKCNIVIDETLYKLRLPKPTNFANYRQQQMDTELLRTITDANNIEFMSKRFALKRYGQVADDDLLTNERMKMEELGIDPDNPPVDYLSKVYGGGQGIGDSGGFLGGGADIPGIEQLGGEPLGSTPKQPPTPTEPEIKK